MSETLEKHIAPRGVEYPKLYYLPRHFEPHTSHAVHLFLRRRTNYFRDELVHKTVVYLGIIFQCNCIFKAKSKLLQCGHSDLWKKYKRTATLFLLRFFLRYFQIKEKCLAQNGPLTSPRRHHHTLRTSFLRRKISYYLGMQLLFA